MVVDETAALIASVPGKKVSTMSLKNMSCPPLSLNAGTSVKTMVAPARKGHVVTHHPQQHMFRVRYIHGIDKPRPDVFIEQSQVAWWLYLEDGE